MERFLTQHKGILNSLGANNCFLNVIIQSFWHLYSFRTSMKEDKHSRNHPAGIFCLKCELRTLLIQYNSRSELLLNPENIRRALMLISSSSTEFHTNSMGCSLEAFEEILKYLHIEQVAGSFRTGPAIGMMDKGCTPACIAHDVFSHEVCDCTYCSCESASEILNTEIGFISSFYVDQIIQLARSKPSSFDEILSVIVQQELHERHRPSRCSFCGETQKLQKICIRSPKVRLTQTFVLSLTWSETSSSKISKFLSTLEPVISLDTVYFMNSEQKDYRRYIIRGMVTFYAQHYIAFFYSASRNSWVQFDDSNVRYIDSWDSVVKKLVSGRMAPVLIFYEAARVLDQVKEAMQMEMIGNPIQMDEGNPAYLNPGQYFENWEEMSSIDLAGFRWGRTEYTSQSIKRKSCSVI